MVKNNITLVIGGCRSGKSSFALSKADNVRAGEKRGQSKIFIATSVPSDTEMKKRVAKHKHERGKEWQTIETPVKIYDTIEQYSRQASVLLVDCLTLWVSNLLFCSHSDSEQNNNTNNNSNNYNKLQTGNSDDHQAQIEQAVLFLENSLASCQCPVFLVSNEVGAGIVPENQIARQFRDYAGFVNQRVAKIADTVIMTIAGIPVQIKP